MAVSHASRHSDAVDQPRTSISQVSEIPQPVPAAPEYTVSPSIIVAAWQRLYVTGLKRTVDLVIASLVLLLLSLLLLLVAVAVRLDSPGPALYRQKRVGRDGRIFTIYKFRTMAQDAGPAVRYFVSGDGTLRHKIHNDPRITRIGAVLRRASIDELPQLINILRGDMSLIGPRPELVEIVRNYQPWQHRRHSVRPGLTGWWQVCGRNDRPMEENTELDLYYIDHLSPGLDLKILLRTVKVVLTGRGAV